VDKYLLEDLEDVDDTRVLNMLKGAFREDKVVPKFRGKYDTKRYKQKYDPLKPLYNNLAGDSMVELK